MITIRSIVLMVCFCLVAGAGVAAYAGVPVAPAKTKEEKMKIMEEHMEKAKMKNPAKYDSMMKNAGGVVTECEDCHKEGEGGKKDK